MGKEANPKLIGAFIVGALALVVIGILSLGQGKFFTDKVPVVMYFTASVGGLQIGAPVNFQGVQIGTVTDITAQFDPKELKMSIPVRAEIEPDRITYAGARRPEDNRGEILRALIEKRGLRARLGLQSFVTGQLSVEIDFHPGTPINLVSGQKKVVEIPTLPSSIEELQASVQTILGKLAALPLEQMMTDISSTVRSTSAAMVRIESIAAKMDNHVDPLFNQLEGTLAEARGAIKTANGAIATVEKNLNQTLRDADRLIVGVDKQVEPLATSAKATSDEIRQTFVRARVTLSNAEVTLRQATKTLKTAETLAAPNSDVRVELSETLRKISDMADSFNSLANYLERNPSALMTGRQGP